MKITLLAIGKKMPAWVNEGFQIYQKRFTPDCPLHLKELDAEKRTKNADLDHIKQQEGQRLLANVPTNERLIALDAQGKQWNTQELSQQMNAWRHDGRNVSLLIGGPEGLSAECLQQAEQRWSLSHLTLPHPLVRVIVAEQLYRALSILNNHPYHR